MRGFRIGRVLDIPIGVDPSWFFLVALIVWSFSTGVFPVRAPGYSPAVYLVMGAAGALLFFVSLLGHELAHAVVARWKGIEVEDITLFLFGGMARTRSEPRTPGDEFQIAAAGPLMSVGIALALLAFVNVGLRTGWPIGVLAVAHYIGLLNVILAVFNLLPGFPLDGGRLFRATVWKVTGDEHRATLWATTAGRWLAYGLMGLGAWSVFGGGAVNGIWLILIGWFLRNAANASYAQHQRLRHGHE